eukprot:CAMPEP_0178669972 /NCGR_PEP_ID=MMETSP0698-20121128/32410_1 /TAXON_ID=265572 /ORGANISM="Extubocellulus spinifer, Strain CCMP396" /LENGTH=378 /DNA_ID=CAMNT_0020313665 /DNA_START=100 /DNA_END=1235 /DNA_ORIENTATION=+
MHVLVIGASGFIGCKLTNRLAAEGAIGEEAITHMTLADVVPPTMPLEDVSFGIETMKLDITDPASIHLVLSGKPDYIFHLAAIVSGDAELNFDLGYKVNVDGTRLLLEAIRADSDYNLALYLPAVFGPPLPPVIPDSQACTPKSSYGIQKAMCELLVEDYSRKGFVDGVSIRFPTITVRPGAPNKAASSFISGIIREPVANMPAICPVSLDTRCAVASPSASVGFLIRAASLEAEDLSEPVANMPAICPVSLDTRCAVASPSASVGFLIRAASLEAEDLSEGRTFNMPSLTVSVEDMIDSLARTTGKHATELIKHEPDPFIMKIVNSWPQEIEAAKAKALGFEPDVSYDSIIETYIDEDLGGWKYHLPLGMTLKPVGP